MTLPSKIFGRPHSPSQQGRQAGSRVSHLMAYAYLKQKLREWTSKRRLGRISPGNMKVVSLTSQKSILINESCVSEN